MEEGKSLIMVPGPTNVPDRVTLAMTKPIINHRGSEFHALYDSIANNLRYAFQTKNDVFVLTSSCTGGVECAVGNVTNPGDVIVVPVFGVFGERLREKILRRGGRAIEIPVDWRKCPTAEQIAQVVDQEKNVKAIALVYNETSAGTTVRDLSEIGKIARKRDILLIVDATSILGGDHLPVDEWGIDLCVAGSQKCLACPPGIAVVSVSKKAWEAVEKTSPRPYYFDLVLCREFDERKETPFTPALPIFYALDEALKMLSEEELGKRIQRHRSCAEAFYAALDALKLKPFPDEEFRSNTVIAVEVPTGVDGNMVQKIMREHYGVVIAGGMRKLKGLIFRIGCMGMISELETIATVNAFEKALNVAGYQVKANAGVEAAKQVFRH